MHTKTYICSVQIFMEGNTGKHCIFVVMAQWLGM